MDLANKLSVIAENVPKVYENGLRDGYDEAWDEAYDSGYYAGYETGKAEGGGGADFLLYATSIGGMFFCAAFPEGYELSLKLPNCTSLDQTFREATGIKKITLDLQTDTAFPAAYFVMMPASKPDASSVEEIVLPDGIKFSNFVNFALRAKKLRTITGAIDLSASTNNGSCFADCYALKNVRFVEGTITKTIDFAAPRDLSRDSVESMARGLDSNVTDQYLRFNSAVFDKLQPSGEWEDLGVIITERGWAFTN